MRTRKHKLHIAPILAVSLVWLILSVGSDVAVSAWEPPIGIPAPSFGIEETYRMYDDPANRNSELTYHQNAEGGYYTHYVDNTHPDATNTDNPFGTPSVPRLTIPITDIQDIPISSYLHALSFKTTHFTAFFLLAGGGAAAIVGGGGGGGGCSVSASGEGNIVEYILPYIGLAVVMVILKMRDARNRKARNMTTGKC